MLIRLKKSLFSWRQDCLGKNRGVLRNTDLGIPVCPHTHSFIHTTRYPQPAPSVIKGNYGHADL
jgi:hypothetical protein